MPIFGASHWMAIAHGAKLSDLKVGMVGWWYVMVVMGVVLSMVSGV